jgi:thiamine biosynthesis protein ThiS
MKLILNGAEERLELAETTVRGLLKAKGWSFPLIIIKVNGALVPRADWDTAAVRDGDAVEAAHLMSGG